MESTLNPEGEADTTRTVVVELVLPAASATVAYWYVTDATPVETAIFATMFLVMMAIIKYLLDNRLEF